MKKWIALSTYFLAGTVCFAGNVEPTKLDVMRDGLFVGLGANYNSLNLTQNSYGKGISTIQTSTGAISNGVGQGNGAPFNSFNYTLGPQVQAGYFKHIEGTPNLVGVKLSYQYLGSTATNPNLYIPQTGQSTNAVTGATSALYGYVNADSVQVNTNHEFSLLAFFGRSFGNTSFYLGAGPSLVNLQSLNYYSIGYANFQGGTINVTGLVAYNSPSIWVLGCTAQLGASYFFSPEWFIDTSYSYTVTGSRTTSHQQTFTNSSSLSGGTTYNTSGTLFTKDTLRTKNQTLMLSINKIFGA